MKIYDLLDTTAPGVVLGNHAVWLPEMQIKVPFQFRGKVTKRSKKEAAYPRDSIADEVAILRALAAERMAPPVGDLVFFKNVISDYPGAWHCDPCGAYGYEIADARRLLPGRFNLDAMKRLPIDGSPGAWGDVGKPDNLVNGYLVDVRRTGWDLLRWCGRRAPLPEMNESTQALWLRVHRDCQFPPGARSEAYQDFYLTGEWQRGQRRVVERARQLGFAPAAGEAVLEVGCQSGGFLQLAALAGARAVGVEIDPVYVDCARALARASDLNICIRQLDAVAASGALVEWIRAYFPGGIDHLLLLSMEKHLGEHEMFSLVDAFGARHTYIETNAVGVTDGMMKLWPEVQARGGVHIGDSRDRNLRRLYRIDRDG